MPFVAGLKRTTIRIIEHFERGFAFVHLGSNEAMARALKASKTTGIKLAGKRLWVRPKRLNTQKPRAEGAQISSHSRLGPPSGPKFVLRLPAELTEQATQLCGNFEL